MPLETFPQQAVTASLGRRWFPVTSLVVSAALSLTACGGGHSSTKGAPAAASAVASASSAVAVTAEVLPSLDANPTQQDASRFLQQATMGPSADDVAGLAGSSINKWLDTQFNMPLVSVNAAMMAANPTGTAFTVDTNGLNDALWGQTIRGPDQLRQRARYSLSQILVLSGWNGYLNGRPLLETTHFDTLGRHAFGNFRELLQEVVLNPGMGVYLSYIANERDYPNNPRRPDENLAREVMQLFTIGLVQLNADGTNKLDSKGNTIPTYDQSVVVGMAKVFTGWAWDHADGMTYSFSVFPQTEAMTSEAKPMVAYADHHSPSEKKILDGVVIPAGGTAESDMKSALDQLFNHPNVGPFIGKQLIQRMVTSNPTPAYVSRVAAVFANNGQGVRGDLKAVFRAILTDPEARSAKTAQGNKFGRLREPILRFTNLARGANLQVAGGALGHVPNLEDQSTAFGESLLRSRTVFGFSRPGYGPKKLVAQGMLAPEFQNATEMSASTVSNSMFQIVHSADQVARFCCGDFPKPDLSRWSAMADQPATLVDDMSTVFTGGMMSTETKLLISSALPEITTDRAEWRRERAQLALHLTLHSADYLIQK